MAKCIVVGGGFAGLSAASLLLENGIDVHLIEASPKIGGRAYSLYNEKFDDEYDNGQHILMGCYYNTISFLKRIGSLDYLDFQKSLNIPFAHRGNKISFLKTTEKHYPFNLLAGLMNYKAITVHERLKIIDFLIDLLFCYEEDLENITVKEWLNEKKQPGNAVKAFWEILVVGALNTKPEKAAASQFAHILKKMFLEGNEASVLVLPNASLNKIFVETSLQYILGKGGSYYVSEKLNEILFDDKNRAATILTDKNSYSDFDFVIVAVPFYSLLKIKPFDEMFKNYKAVFSYSPILNVHLWLKENNFSQKFYGLIDSKIHWLFNHKKHVTLVTSAADNLIDLPNEKILGMFYSELESYFNLFQRENVVDWKIIREKRATFIPNNNFCSVRKKIDSPFSNLFFAGDWTNTGLPSTIESAVYSGHLAAEKIIE